MKPGAGWIGRISKCLLSLLAAATVVVASACGGGGGGSSSTAPPPSTGSSTKVVITGTLSYAVQAKPSINASAAHSAISGFTWSGATLQVVDGSGAVIGTGTVNADGSYSVSVDPGSNYFIRVQSGNLVLKAFVLTALANTSVNVTPTTTAEVLVLAQVLGVANAGDSGVSAASALASVNVGAVVVQITANPNIAALANTLAANILASYDSSSSAASIGAADPSVSSSVTAISAVVSTTAVPAAPSSPSGVGVAAGNGQVIVTWNAVTGATSYNIYYRSAPNVTIANGTKVANAASGGAITGLTNGTAYYFVVTAVNAGGESAISSEVGATPQVPAPGAPTGISVTGGVSQATVSWTAVAGAASYNIYYDTASGVIPTGDKVTKITGATSGYAVTGLLNGTRYYFVVSAVNAGGESAVSSEVNVTPQVPAPSAPTGVGVTPGNAQVTVTWTAPAGTVTSYNVYYRAATPNVSIGGTGVILKAGMTSGGAIIPLTNGTTYYFVVTAVNAGVESVISNEVAATPQESAPAAPTNPGAFAGNGNVTVSWTAPAGTVTSYNVYYRAATPGVTTANGTKVPNATSGGTINSLANGTIYYFVVTAVNGGGESVISSEVSATPQAVAQGAPTGVSVTGGNGNATVSWTTPAGSTATSYNVYWSTVAGFTPGTAQGSALGIAGTSKVVNGLTNGTQYYFIVTGVSPDGESSAGTGTGLFDGAENGIGLWTAGSPWGIATGASNAGTHSFTDSPAGDYAHNMNTSLTLATPLNFTSAANPVLSFSHKYATETGYDYCYVEISTDGGAVWTQLATYNGSLAAWTPVSINLGAYAGQASVKLRFRFTSDHSVALDGWYLDDITITGSSTQVSVIPLVPPGAPTLSAVTMPGDGRVTINWTAPAGGGAVASYNIYYIAGTTVTTTTAGAVDIPAISGASTSYTVNGLTNGTQYAFIVSAANSGGETASATVVTATPSGAWSVKTPMLYQRDNAANAVLNGKIYVVGGAPAGISVLSSMEVYDPAANTWPLNNPATGTPWASMPAARYGPAAVGMNGMIYVFSGTDIVNGQSPIYQTIVYDPNTNVWSTTVPVTSATTAAGTAGAALAPIPTGRWGFDVVVVDGLIYAIGGAVQSAAGINTYYSTVEVYDPVLNTWATKAAMPTPRWGMTVSVVNGLIYAIGGWGGWPELAMVEIYDPAANTWSTTVPATAATTAAGTAGAALAPMPTARDDFGFAVVNGLIYAIGGDINTFDDYARTSCCTTVVEAYDPVTNAWTTKAPMPTIRDDFDASMVDGVIYAIAGSRDGKFTDNPTPPPGSPPAPALTQAFLDANNGGFSLTMVEAYTSSGIPVPNGVTATAAGNQVSLSWNAVAGASSYNIYWSNKAGVSTTANSTKIANGNLTTYAHSGLTAGTWYYYVVTAVTASGESLPSNEVAVKP